MTRLTDRAIRARNESAWLIPDGDTRVDHRLRDEMRHYDGADDLDLVVVGCGAGGRLFSRGWPAPDGASPP